MLVVLVLATSTLPIWWHWSSPEAPHQSDFLAKSGKQGRVDNASGNMLDRLISHTMMMLPSNILQMNRPRRLLAACCKCPNQTANDPPSPVAWFQLAAAVKYGGISHLMHHFFIASNGLQTTMTAGSDYYHICNNIWHFSSLLATMVKTEVHETASTCMSPVPASGGCQNREQWAVQKNTDQDIVPGCLERSTYLLLLVIDLGGSSKFWSFNFLIFAEQRTPIQKVSKIEWGLVVAPSKY